MEGDSTPLNQAAFLVQDFLTQAANYLNECLDAGPLQAGIVQGSAFCGAISCTPEGAVERALISPEELTAVMTLKLLEEAPDE